MSHRFADQVLLWSLRTSAVASALILAAIVAFTMLESLPALKALGVARFVVDGSWHPLSNAFGMGPMIAGSAAVSLLALAIAIPLGVAVAVVEQFYLSSAWKRFSRRCTELLSSIPSVVLGIWGLTCIVPLLAWIRPPGVSLLAAALILSMMLIPTIVYFSSMAFERTGVELRLASAALGLGRMTLILQLATPLARRGIAAGIVVALARAVGETLVVLMVAGNVPGWPTAFLEPIRTLTANIALEMAYAEGLHRSALFVSGVFVMMLALVLVAIATRVDGGGSDDNS